MDYKKTLMKRWFETNKQLSLQKEMEKITNQLKEQITKKKKKKQLKVVGVYEEPKEIEPCSIMKVFSDINIREQIMEHKQKLLDDEWEKFKHIDWSKIMTIDQLRDIITEFARSQGHICDLKTSQYRFARYNLKLDWTGLLNVIHDLDNNCNWESAYFWNHHLNDMDYYYERQAFQRYLNGEPLIDTSYERQYPPKKKNKKLKVV